MSSTLSVRVPRRAPLLAVPLLLPALAAGCGGGNPTCVFVGACGGSQRSDEISGNPAVTPEDGWFILDSRPRVTDVFPSGGNIAASTPVIVVFSESMHPDTVRGAFEIVPVGGNIVSDPVQGVTEALVAENRVLVLLPPQDLDPGAYIVRVGTPEPAGGGNPFGGGGTTTTGTMAEMPTDVTGQELQQNTGVQVGSTFTVVVSPPVPPQLVTAYPFDGSTGASDTAQIVVVVDRPLAATSVSDGSFVVELDGNDPNPDPVASFLDLGAGSDGRVLLWQSAVAGGDPVPLGADVAVEVTLSPSGNRLRDTEGEELATQSFDFRTIPFTTPLGAGLMSEPTDAIGRRNLTPDGNEDLSVQVDLLDAEPGDFLDLFLVGPSTDENDPILVALRRDLRLTTAAPIQSATYGVHAVDLTVGGNPERPRLGDGFVAFAFRLRRGAFVSPLRLLDVDVGLEGIQDPLLDTTAPTILRLGIPTMASGNTTGSADLVSDLSNLAIAGVADETLESVEVTATDGMRNLGNGVLPGVVGSRADGGFVAAPVELGVFDTARAEYTAVAYDRAFNASVPVMGTFTQRGAVGPTPFAPGMDLTVEVFDALTLEPIQGAVAMVHADLGDGVSYPFHAAGLTGPAGTLTLDTGYPGAVGVVLTVEAGGHDLFTFHGVTGTRVSVPLEPSGGATASVAGTVSSEDPVVMAFLGGLDRLMDDSRLPLGTQRTYSTQACQNFLFAFTCGFGPRTIRAERLGAQSFFAGDFEATESTFNANQLLQAFCLEIPVGPAVLGGTDDTSFELAFLLTDPSVDPEERPDEITGFSLDASATAGLDPMRLVDKDPDTTGDPQVSVEARIPGLHGTVAVGLGLAFEQMTAGLWTVRAARPGAVSPTGFFGERDAVDTDLFLRAELEDEDGNVSGVRPRQSSLMAPFALVAPDVPALVAPALSPTPAGSAFVLEFPDTIADGVPGLYRAELIGVGGRRWTLWVADADGAANVRLRVPDPADGGGVGLPDGDLSCTIASWSYASLDAAEFLWTDVEREHEGFARAAAVTLRKGP